MRDHQSEGPGKPGKRNGRRSPGTGRSRKKTDSQRRTGQSQGISVRRIQGDVYELVYPRKARLLRDDIEEVYDMIAHEEWDLAVDELLWLLRECRELLEAHQLLGRIALFQNKLDLARAHLGHAYELGLNATGKDFRGRLPFTQAANRPLLQATRDLVECLIRLNERDLATSVAQRLLQWDPSDPLHVRDLFPPS
ncbi:MAG: hypothetical protein WBH86_14215 [Thermogutta sp.]